MTQTVRRFLLIAGCLLLLLTSSIHFLFVGLAPYTDQSPAPVELWEETVDTADYYGIDYGRLVSSAYNGDRFATLQLMQATKTLSGSGAGSYGHGAALLEVLWRNGEASFIKILKTLPVDEQKRLLFVLSAGDEHTFNTSQQGKLKTAFPILTKYSNSFE